MTKKYHSILDFMQFILERKYYCWMMIAIFSLSPFTSWISMTIATLYTLRVASYSGLQCFIVAITGSLLGLTYYNAPYISCALVTLNYLFCFALAMFLRNGLSWKNIAHIILIISVLVVFLGHWFMQEFIVDSMQSVMRSVDSVDSENLLMVLKNSQYQDELAHYFWSIRVCSYVLSPLMSLLFARSIQSQLYYPGGFREEIYKFHANPIISVFFVLILYGVYVKNIYAISAMPVLFFYFLMSGILFAFKMLRNQKKWIAGFAVLFPLFFIPYVFLLVYALFGLIDSIMQINIFKRS